MMAELRRFLAHLEPAFSRRAAHLWCLVAFIGLVARTDTLGVTSIIRALSLGPVHYPALLHFFHSTAWCAQGLMARWWVWLADSPWLFRHQGRLVLIGDHTKSPKDGRKMPAVVTLHQDSETASKPSFFRGHHWGVLAVLTHAADAWRATPLWAAIHEGTDDTDKTPKTVRIVNMARTILNTMRQKAYLVLDAYFSVGPVFAAAATATSDIFVLTRAKKTYVAFRPASPRKKGKKGRSKKYGTKLHLYRLFDLKSWQGKFSTGSALVYDHRETIRYLVIDLLWKPIKGTVRFILVETSRGRMVLMSSDLHLDPIAGLELYCHRVPIETLFNILKNTFGAFAYHFWSSYLAPVSRRPAANPDILPPSTNPRRTRETLAAIEKFVNLQFLVLGFLHLMAFRFPNEVRSVANCWLRTVSRSIPSEFVTRQAFVNLIKPSNFAVVGLNWITALIAPRQSAPYEKHSLDKGLG